MRLVVVFFNNLLSAAFCITGEDVCVDTNDVPVVCLFFLSFHGLHSTNPRRTFAPSV